MQTAAGLVGFGVIEPVGLGGHIVGSAYLHTVAPVKLGFDRAKRTVDTGELGLLAYLGMHFERKVQRSGSLRQDNSLALRGKRQYILVVQRRAHAVHEDVSVTTVGDVLEHGLEALQPALATLYYTTEPGITVHTFRGDVHLFPGTGAVKQLHVEALVAVIFGIVDIVHHAPRTLLETPRKARINEKAGILLRRLGTQPFIDRVVYNAHKVLEIYVGEVAAFLAHGTPDAVRLAVADLGAGGNAYGLENLVYLRRKIVHGALGTDLILLQLAENHIVFTRAAETEREILQLGFDMIQSEASGKRSIEEVGLAGDFHLLVGTHAVQGAHVVQAVGQLDEQGADVVVHRLKYLAVIIHLLCVLVVVLLALGHHINQERHIVAETLPDILDGVRSIFGNVVQERRYDGIGVKLKLFCGDVRYGYRMHDIRLAGIAPLVFVRLGGKSIRIFDTLQVLRAHALSHHVKYVLSSFLYPFSLVHIIGRIVRWRQNRSCSQLLRIRCRFLCKCSGTPLVRPGRRQSRRQHTTGNLRNSSRLRP